MADAQAKFLTGNLFRHVSTMSLAASIGLMAIFAVDFIDMIFISMLGNAALAAAVGYAGAILFFTTSFSIGMAIAAGALVARALGSGEHLTASRRAATALLYGIVFGSLFAALVWLNLARLVDLLGATGATADLAVNYLQIIIPTLPVMTAGMIGGAILRAHGDARRSMMATIIAGVVNAVLDPILIFGLDMELTGAALASVAARFAMAYASLAPVVRHYGGFDKPTSAEFRIDFPVIMGIAFPAILTQFATPLGQAVVTRSMAEFGEAAVAGMAIIGRLTPVAFGVIFALSGAVGPIIGQNFGANQHDRVRGAFNAAVIFVGIFVVAMTLLLFLVRGPIAAVFQADGITLELLFLFCGPLALAFFFNGLLFIANAAFNNLNHPFYSTWLNWGRHTLGTIPFVLLGAAWFGAPGVLIGQAAGGVIFGLLAWALAARIMGKDHDPKPKDLFARQGRQLSLFHHRR